MPLRAKETVDASELERRPPYESMEHMSSDGLVPIKILSGNQSKNSLRSGGVSKFCVPVWANGDKDGVCH